MMAHKWEPFTYILQGHPELKDLEIKEFDKKEAFFIKLWAWYTDMNHVELTVDLLKKFVPQ